MCSEGIDGNGQLFIAGYSEGGYVAMATHKLIEEKYSEEFKVTASAPMAGPYDMSYSSRRILSIDEYPQPGYISFTYMSYNSIEKLDRPASDLFKSPFAERIPGLMDGSKSIDEANSYLTTSIKGLFAEKFLNDFLGEGEVELKKKFEENSLLDWQPIGPIKLFHGTDDDEVNYNNSLIALDKLKSGGANIELITIPGGSHSSSVLISYAQALEWFNTLKKQYDMNKALIVGICGGSGSGKTIIANQLSQKFKNSSVIINIFLFRGCGLYWSIRLSFTSDF